MLRLSLFGLLTVILLTLSGTCADPDLPDGTAKALKQMTGLRYPKELTLALFAAEPQVASPVAISVDERGRVFVAEEYRFSRGTEENRTRSFLLEDDLQVKSMGDRLKMYEKWSSQFEGGMEWFRKHSDQVRLLEDRAGVGRADHSEVFAGGFNAPLDGLAAGVLARHGKVWLANIPNLWLLENGQRTPLLTGFGVSCAFLGHDLHGLIFGPDGKLYFSIGDRGYNVTSREGLNFTGLRTGAVFRCDPDGANFEVVMTGLRNPQELAFDQFGNLFAADNNCDKGDDARLVYVLEGGDAGWNMAYQTMPAPYMAGPWFAERLWHLPHAGQPAYLLPPIGKIGTGPSGFLFTSGASLPARYENSFLLCNFTGTGGLEAFRLKPVGAAYAIDDYHDFLKPIQATDVDLGPDGKLYVADFGALDWSGKSTGGRIFTLADDVKLKSPAIVEMKQVFAEGFDKQTIPRLGVLLGHPEMKLRLRAQYEIASRGLEGEKLFQKLAMAGEPRLKRLHAIWGLGQMARAKPSVLDSVVTLLDDTDEEVVAQAVKVLGDGRRADAGMKLIALLKHPSPRVKLFAAETLGKLKNASAVTALFEVLRTNADVYIRHAVVVALTRIGDAEAVNARAADASAGVRMGALLVQRRNKDSRLVRFLNDPDLDLRLEAARAIHDLPLLNLYPTLAKTLETLDASLTLEGDPLVRRAIDANFVLGTAENAKAVLAVAMNAHASRAMRAEAVSTLRDWSDPPKRDRVTGFWRPLDKRDPAIVRGVVEPTVNALLASTSGPLQSDAIALVGALSVAVDEDLFATWVLDPKQTASIRTAALRVLGSRQSARLEAALSTASHDADASVRIAAREVLMKHDAARGLAAFTAVLNDNAATVLEKQRALLALPKLKGSDALLDAWALKLSTDEVPPELRLDVLDALKAAPSVYRRVHLAKFDAGEPKDTLGKHRTALAGGDPEAGRDIFTGHSAAQCVRCHKVAGHGGTAGPDLSQVATRTPDKTREYLLESLLLPNVKLAAGYATVTLALADGRTVAGTLMAEDTASVKLQTPEGKMLSIAKEDIESRTQPASTMPTMDRTLSIRELRDLVAYLATLK